MGNKYPLVDLDIERYRLQCGVKLLDAVHSAMAEGSSAPENYADALFAALNYLQGISEGISSSVDACLEKFKGVVPA